MLARSWHYWSVACIFYLGTWHFESFALSICRPYRTRCQLKHQRNKKQITIHRIKDPRLKINHEIDDENVDINDPDLYIDHMEEFGVEHEHDNRVIYLATWQDESTVIGMVEVMPNVNGYWDADRLPKFLGLRLDEVTVGKKHKRKGVATNMFRSIERDAKELVELTDLVNRHAELTGTAAEHYGESIELRLCSVGSREALSFYRAMGYQFQSWQQYEGNYLHPSIFGKLRRRLTWTWGWVSVGINDLTFNLTYDKPWEWLCFRVPEPSRGLVKRLDFHCDE